VLESGEYLRVGSSKVQKTDVRVIAATNVNVFDAVQNGKFREDLYYRLNTVPLKIPALRERKEDIHLIFRKFIADFTNKYRSPSVQLDADAQQMLINYSWPGNVRQLKNVAEQIAVLEKDRNLTVQSLQQYIPQEHGNLPMRINQGKKEDLSERDILYKVLFDMKRDMVELKKLVAEIIQNGGNAPAIAENPHLIHQLYRDIELPATQANAPMVTIHHPENDKKVNFDYSHHTEEVEESLSLIEKESDLIKKALKKHKGKRKLAAQELGISERTLYRKIKELDLT
jgi:DNA-binding NtrC family response regulator